MTKQIILTLVIIFTLQVSPVNKRVKKEREERQEKIRVPQQVHSYSVDEVKAMVAYMDGKRRDKKFVCPDDICLKICASAEVLQKHISSLHDTRGVAKICRACAHPFVYFKDDDKTKRYASQHAKKYDHTPVIGPDLLRLCKVNIVNQTGDKKTRDLCFKLQKVFWGRS